MAIKRTTKIDSSFSMSSMTDIVFLLLIFFLVTSTLINLLQTEEDPTFSIYADETVPIREVVKVMNIAKRNHYKVIMATSPE